MEVGGPDPLLPVDTGTTGACEETGVEVVVTGGVAVVIRMAAVDMGVTLVGVGVVVVGTPPEPDMMHTTRIQGNEE